MSGADFLHPRTGNTSSRFGHYWDVATPRKVEDIKSKTVAVDPMDFDDSEEFTKVGNEKLLFRYFCRLNSIEGG